MKAISASSLNDLLICNRRWAYSHGVDPNVEKGPPNEYLTLGQALHSAIRFHYDGKNPYEGIEEAKQEARDAGGTVEMAHTHADGLFGAFREWEKAEKPGKPISQEGKVEFEIEGHTFVGYIDALYPGKIRDWKSATKPWDFKKQKDAWLQGTAYSIAKGISQVEFVVFSWQAGYSYGIYPLTVTPLHVERLKALVRAYGPLIQETDIEKFPINPSSMNYLCSSRWCPFFQVCPGGEPPIEEAI